MRQPHHRGADQHELREAGEHDRAGQQRAGARRRVRLAQHHGRDRCDQHGVEHDKPERGGADPALGVEHRGGHRHDARDRHVRHRKADIFDGEREPRAGNLEARRQQPHHERGEQHAEQCGDAEHDQHGAERLLAEPPGARPAGFLAQPHPHRDERGVERALGQQPAEQVGDLQGGEEGVRQHAGAEHGRDAGVADEPEQTR